MFCHFVARLVQGVHPVTLLWQLRKTYGNWKNDAKHKKRWGKFVGHSCAVHRIDREGQEYVTT